MIKTEQTGNKREPSLSDSVSIKNLQLIPILIVNDNVFPLRLGKRQGYLLSPFSFYIIQEVTAGAMRQEEIIKGTEIGKGEILIKLSLFTIDMSIYIGNPKESTNEINTRISEFSKVEGYIKSIVCL